VPRYAHAHPYGAHGDMGDRHDACRPDPSRDHVTGTETPGFFSTSTRAPAGCAWTRLPHAATSPGRVRRHESYRPRATPPSAERGRQDHTPSPEKPRGPRRRATWPRRHHARARARGSARSLPSACARQPRVASASSSSPRLPVPVSGSWRVRDVPVRPLRMRCVRCPRRRGVYVPPRAAAGGGSRRPDRCGRGHVR
jgi:hypothetical protein